jgi:hypothetical protein
MEMKATAVMELVPMPTTDSDFRPTTKKHRAYCMWGFFYLCAGEESNLHAFRRYHLKVVRLPFRHPRKNLKLYDIRLWDFFK